jgi:hypothetical protein
MSTINYKIPKVQVKADILVHHGDVEWPEEYMMFLNEYSRYRKGQESIYEFLNKKKKFIPLKVCSSGEFIGLNLDDIIYVREKNKFEIQTDLKLTLYLKNNVQIEVDHFNQLPDSQSRVLDYLNQESQFILFRHEECKIFINRHKIIKVIEQ